MSRQSKNNRKEEEVSDLECSHKTYLQYRYFGGFIDNMITTIHKDKIDGSGSNSSRGNGVWQATSIETYSQRVKRLPLHDRHRIPI